MAKPGAPRNVKADVPCVRTRSCPGNYLVVKVTWTAPSGPVSGYRIYYTPGEPYPCKNTWKATGSPKLLATLSAKARSWSGKLNELADGGKYSVVAFNPGGSSSPAMTDWVMAVDVGGC